MKTMLRGTTMTLSAAVFVTFFASQASAGCGDPTQLQGHLEFVQQSPGTRFAPQAAHAEDGSPLDWGSVSIVGMWKVQFISQGNLSHNPPIPDNALIDFGYSQWHSDGTEIMNSGGRAPATQNFCLGVWGRTGFLTYELNHFALSYDAVTGAMNANVNIREEVTLSPSGDKYTGTFTIDVFDPHGNHVDHLGGDITATRLTVDSTLP
jgi:hypothetical protein